MISFILPLFLSSENQENVILGSVLIFDTQLAMHTSLQLYPVDILSAKHFRFYSFHFVKTCSANQKTSWLYNTLQTLESELAFKVASMLQKRAALSLENNTLKQQVARLRQEKLIVDGEFFTSLIHLFIPNTIL